jgi:hypothetical protein
MNTFREGFKSTYCGKRQTECLASFGYCHRDRRVTRSPDYRSGGIDSGAADPAGRKRAACCRGHQSISSIRRGKGAAPLVGGTSSGNITGRIRLEIFRRGGPRSARRGGAQELPADLAPTLGRSLYLGLSEWSAQSSTNRCRSKKISPGKFIKTALPTSNAEFGHLARSFLVSLRLCAFVIFCFVSFNHEDAKTQRSANGEANLRTPKTALGVVLRLPLP